MADTKISDLPTADALTDESARADWRQAWNLRAELLNATEGAQFETI